MEYRIRIFIKWFAVFLALWFSGITIDEYLPLNTRLDEVSSRYQETENNRYSHLTIYYLNVGNRSGLQVPKMVYDSVLPYDVVKLHVTPVFKQLRTFDIQLRRMERVFSVGYNDEYRESCIIMGYAVVILSILSAFVVRSFEFRMTTFFFAFIIAALRWWFFME